MSKMDLLWNNATSAAFAAQTISVDLFGYNYIAINTDNNKIFSIFNIVTDKSFCLSGVVEYPMYRIFNIISNGIQSGSSYYHFTGYIRYLNDYMNIPYQIY